MVIVPELAAPLDAPALELAPLVDEPVLEPLDAALGEPPQATTASRGISRKKSFVGRMFLSLANGRARPRIMCAG